jgi:hypothetical protein
MNLQTLSDQCWRWALARIATTGPDIPFVFIAYDQKRQYHVISIPGYPKNREGVLVVLAAYCFAYEVTAYVVVSSAWLRLVSNPSEEEKTAALKTPPSQSPDRIDALILSGRSSEAVLLRVAEVVPGKETTLRSIPRQPDLFYPQGHSEYARMVGASRLHSITDFAYLTGTHDPEPQAFLREVGFSHYAWFESIAVFPALNPASN